MEIEQLSLSELKALHERIGARYADLREQALQSIRNDMAQFGITEKMIHEAIKKRRKRRSLVGGNSHADE